MKRRQKQHFSLTINKWKKEANMNFEELHNTVENFFDAHSFNDLGKPVFDYDHQCFDYDVRSTFYYSLRYAAFKNEKLANILVRLTKKEKLDKKENLTIHIFSIIESLTEKSDNYEEEYIRKSNEARRNKCYEELQSLYIDFNTVTETVERMIRELYSLIEDLEYNNVNLRERYSSIIAQYREIGKKLDEAFVPVREDFDTEQRYLACFQYHEKIQAAESERFEAEYQKFEALIKQFSEQNQEEENMKIAS